ncbi:tegument protein UL37 [Testudinid alphaherpesvirus 3]|uniref:Tegument protein UL37 n=2 Tax=Herpesvirales TaxID=548681 RepID=A0A0K1R1C1_9ALPH|nr:tegument protein UL37 [Testudinid alphaherpesvirus 3]AAY59063.1 small tegument protein [Tortoise herpesvirus]AIU39240.1 tegument protein UL37 [Testudinid alphaherpesvirus 3]AKV40709.1 UL37 capsid assembly protein [Testudinid alphaherpesvirus 3]
MAGRKTRTRLPTDDNPSRTKSRSPSRRSRSKSPLSIKSRSPVRSSGDFKDDSSEHGLLSVFANNIAQILDTDDYRRRDLSEVKSKVATYIIQFISADTKLTYTELRDKDLVKRAFVLLKTGTQYNDPWVIYAYKNYIYFLMRKLKINWENNYITQTDRLRKLAADIYDLTVSVGGPKISENDSRLNFSIYSTNFQLWCTQFPRVINKATETMYQKSFEPSKIITSLVDRRFDMLYDHEFVQGAFQFVAHKFNWVVQYNILIDLIKRAKLSAKPIDIVLIIMGLSDEFELTGSPHLTTLGPDTLQLFSDVLSTINLEAALLEAPGSGYLPPCPECKRVARSMISKKPVEIPPNDTMVSWVFDVGFGFLTTHVSPKYYAFCVPTIITLYRTRRPIEQEFTKKISEFIVLLDDLNQVIHNLGSDSLYDIMEHLTVMGFTRINCQRYVMAMMDGPGLSQPMGITEELLQRLTSIAYLGHWIHHLYEHYSISHQYVEIYKLAIATISNQIDLFNKINMINYYSYVLTALKKLAPTVHLDKLKAIAEENAKFFHSIKSVKGESLATNSVAANTFETIYDAHVSDQWDRSIKNEYNKGVTYSGPQEAFRHTPKQLYGFITTLIPGASVSNEAMVADPDFPQYFIALTVRGMIEQSLSLQYSYESTTQILGLIDWLNSYGISLMNTRSDYRKYLSALINILNHIQNTSLELEQSTAHSLETILTSLSTTIDESREMLPVEIRPHALEIGPDNTYLRGIYDLSYGRAYELIGNEITETINKGVTHINRAMRQLIGLRNFFKASFVLSDDDNISISIGGDELGTWRITTIIHRLGGAIRACMETISTVSGLEEVLSGQAERVQDLINTINNKTQQSKSHTTKRIFSTIVEKFVELLTGISVGIQSLREFVARVTTQTMVQPLELLSELNSLMSYFTSADVRKVDGPAALINIFNMGNELFVSMAKRRTTNSLNEAVLARAVGQNKQAVRDGVMDILENTRDDNEPVFHPSTRTTLTDSSDLFNWSEFNTDPLLRNIDVQQGGSYDILERKTKLITINDILSTIDGM